MQDSSNNVGEPVTGEFSPAGNAPGTGKMASSGQGNNVGDVVSPDFSTATPANFKPNIPTEQPAGLINRAYESSGLKSVVDLAGQKGKYSFQHNPVQMFHDAVDAFHSGDWKTGTETALKLARIIPDRDDPLFKAAESLVMQPIENIKAAAKQYGQNRSAGKGAVESAFASPNGGESSPDTNLIQAVPIVGPMVGQLGTLMSTDIHDKNWKGLAGDVLGPLLSFGAGKALEGLAGGTTTARVAGDVENNLVRPGVKNIAGVDVPVATTSVGDQSLASKIVQKGATPTGAQHFIDNYTQPAAAQANVANIGQFVVLV